ASGSLGPRLNSKYRSVGELQADTDGVEILAVAIDVAEHALVHGYDIVVDHQANIAVEIPVDAESEHPLVATKNAAGNAGVPVEVGVGVTRHQFPGAPASTLERERRRGHQHVEAAHFVVERGRRIGL